MASKQKETLTQCFRLAGKTRTRAYEHETRSNVGSPSSTLNWPNLNSTLGRGLMVAGYMLDVVIFAGSGQLNPSGDVDDTCAGDSGGPAVRELMVDSEARERKWVQGGG